MVGARFCRRHGGTLRKRIGPANSNWKGGISPMRPGRWTSRFPGPLQPQYIAALRDPDILSLESEIALIDVRLGELVQRTGRHAEWSEVKDAYEAQMAAVQSGDSAQIKASFERMAALAYGQVDNDAAWTALIRLTDRRRALVESERRRLVEQNMFLSREQAHAYGHAVLESITRHVKDRQTLIRVLGDLRAVLDAGRDSPGTGIPGGLALVGGRTGTD